MGSFAGSSTCPRCNRPCSSPAGLAAHQRFCKGLPWAGDHSAGSAQTNGNSAGAADMDGGGGWKKEGRISPAAHVPAATPAPAHPELVAKPGSHECPHCGKVVGSKAGLDVHVEKFCTGLGLSAAGPAISAAVASGQGFGLDGTPKAELICPECGKECQTRQGLLVHKSSCGKEKKRKFSIEDMTCPHCGKLCGSRAGLAVHVKKCARDSKVHDAVQSFTPYTKKPGDGEGALTSAEQEPAPEAQELVSVERDTPQPPASAPRPVASALRQRGGGDAEPVLVQSSHADESSRGAEVGNAAYGMFS